VSDDLRAVVWETGGGSYRVRTEDGREFEATLRGRVKRGGRGSDRVVIGDHVLVALQDDGSSTIEEVLPRQHVVARRTLGGRKEKAVAANLDHLVVVMAARSPDPNLQTLDRFLVTAESAGIPAILVLNKVDLEGASEVAEEMSALYREAGYEVALASAVSGEGLEELTEVLCRGISALVGPSGVGKSTLLNALDSSLDLRTGALSRKVSRGRHTTAHSRLIRLSCGGAVADTPGFSEVGIWGAGSDELAHCFPEFRPHLGKCRFSVCTHDHEPGCAVKEAVEAGEISDGRYASYLTLLGEAQEAERGPGG
jgi:ribosome biogenesis GTPase